MSVDIDLVIDPTHAAAYDLAVIGDGVLGLSCALAAQKVGARVLLIGPRDLSDASRPSTIPETEAPTSQRATGMLAPWSELLFEPETPGPEKCALMFAARQLWDDPFWQSVADLAGRGTLLLVPDAMWAARLAGLQRAALPFGSEGISAITAVDARNMVPELAEGLQSTNRGMVGGVMSPRLAFCPNEIVVNPLQTLSAMVRRYLEKGGTHCRATWSEGWPTTAMPIWRLAATDAYASTSQAIAARQLVVCTGYGTTALPTGPQVLPAKGQLMAIRSPIARQIGAVRAPGLYWARRDDEIGILGATMEPGAFDISVTGAASDLQTRMAQIIPALGKSKGLAAWAGIRPVSADGMPFITPLLSNVHAINGLGRNGWLLAPLVATSFVQTVLTRQPSGFWSLLADRQTNRALQK